MKYSITVIKCILLLAFSSCSTEEDINSHGFVNAYGEVHRMDYAIADYAPYPTGFDQIFLMMSNRPLPHSDNGSIPTWNYALRLDLVSTLTSRDDYSGSYPLKGYGELEDEGELEGGELSYLTGAVLYLNMKYEDGKWDDGERLFEWTDGHVEISKANGAYLLQFSLTNEKNTFTGEYEGPIKIEEAL